MDYPTSPEHEFLADITVGSGVLSYEYYGTSHWHRDEDDGPIVGLSVNLIDPDDETQYLRKIVRFEDIYGAAAALLAKATYAPYHLAAFAMIVASKHRPDLRDSFDGDSDTADLLIQQATFGEVIYG